MHLKENKYETGEKNTIALSPNPISNHFQAGRLRLGFERAPGLEQTVLTNCEQQPPLRVVRAFTLQDGQALVHLHNLSGGVLGGDQLELTIDVGSGSAAQITSTGATRLYRSRHGAPVAKQQNKIRVDENALLEYLPDALIPFAGSGYFQETDIELAQGAGLFWWETVAPGREASGELFAYDLLQFKLDLRAEGMILAQERIKLEPEKRPLLSSIRFGHYRYFSTFYICRVGLEARQWTALESELSELSGQWSCPSEILWGVSTLPAHGLVVRALSVNGRSITAGLLAFWQAAKLRLYGRPAIPPRKVY